MGDAILKYAILILSMEEQTVSNQIQETPVNPAPISKKPNQWLIAAIIFVAIVVTGSIFTILLNSQKSTSPPPSSIRIPPTTTQPSPTPTLTSFIMPTTNPLITGNWKTYTNLEIGFSIKLPQSWNVKKTEKVDGIETVWISSNSPYKTSSTVENLEIIIGSPFIYSTSGVLCANQSCEKEAPFEVKIAGRTYPSQVIKASTGEEKKFERYSFQIEKDGDIPYITGSYFTKEEQEDIIQILSTFKFTNQNDQVVCTKEAKLCPDGKTYVGRQGPSCEFAPCP